MTPGRSAARSAAKGEADESESESGGAVVKGKKKNHIIIYLFKFTVAKRHN